MSSIILSFLMWQGIFSSRCVCRFTSHVNQSHPISAVISPCAQFIATGSEDRAVYVYDIRYPSPLHKVTSHSDVVSTVAYHPLKSMVCKQITLIVMNEVLFHIELCSLWLPHWMEKSVCCQQSKSNDQQF